MATEAASYVVNEANKFWTSVRFTAPPTLNDRGHMALVITGQPKCCSQREDHKQAG